MTSKDYNKVREGNEAEKGKQRKKGGRGRGDKTGRKLDQTGHNVKQNEQLKEIRGVKSRIGKVLRSRRTDSNFSDW